MKRRQILIGLLVIALLTLGVVAGLAYAQGPNPGGEPILQETTGTAARAPLGTGFTYQGQLELDGELVSDECGMQFRLYDGPESGVPVGGLISTTVPITDGLFTVDLDFADAFADDARWLEIKVKCLGDADYADLGRQELTAAPYATYALSTGSLQGYPVAATAPISGQVLEWDGSAWGPAIDNNTTYSAGNQLDLTGGTFDVLEGAGSGLDADLLDGEHGAYYLDWANLSNVPVGLADGVDGVEYAGVVVVAKSGGDYATIQAAIDSIGDASADQPYLVWVAPGVYSETVQMKPYVHLQGAGQEATVVTSTISTDDWAPLNATLMLTAYTSLRDLTVANGGTGKSNTAIMASMGTTQTVVANVIARADGGGVNQNIGIYLYGYYTGVLLEDVTALALGEGNGAYGLYLASATATVRGGSFTGHAVNARGILNWGGTLDAEGTYVLGEASDGEGVGLYNWGATVLRGGSVTGRSEGFYGWGILNDTWQATLETESVTILAEGGDYDNRGLYNMDSAEATLRGGSCTARGGNWALGIHISDNGSVVNLDGVAILAEDGTDYSVGIGQYGGATTVHGGSIIAKGGGDARGIHNYGSPSTLTAGNVTIRATEGITNTGLYCLSGSSTTVAQGIVEGDTNVVYLDTAAVFVTHTLLEGGPVSGLASCVAVSKDYVFHDSGCP